MGTEIPQAVQRGLKKRKKKDRKMEGKRETYTSKMTRDISAMCNEWLLFKFYLKKSTSTIKKPFKTLQEI